MPRKQPVAADALSGLDLNLLVTLDALLRTGSVTRAAESLDVSQSAVSHSLARLRKVFGDPLFVKAHNKMAPTPKALAIAATVAEIVSLVRTTLAPQVEFSPEIAQQTITLCLDDIGELAILPQLMAQLGAIAPGCSLRTMPTEGVSLEQILESGRAHLAITGPQRASRDLKQQKLYSHIFTVIASQACPLEHSITAKQYSSMQHIAFRSAVASSAWLDGALAKSGIERRIRLSTPHHLIVPLLVEQDPGIIATVPHLVAQTYVKFTNIKILTPRFELPKIDVYQFWHPRFDADPVSVWLRTFIRNIFYRHPALHIE
jgi:DNA-binding transcriptional LysR family regulator